MVILALDYSYEPRASYTVWTIVRDVPRIRIALLDMVPSAIIAADYLFSSRDVDTSQFIVLGYSFGAPFVPVIVAHDRRAAVAAIVYGGGELTSLIRHKYQGTIPSGWVNLLLGLAECSSLLWNP